MEDFFTASVEMMEVPLVKELGRMILTDAIDLYNALHAYITAAIPKIFGLNEEVALKLDELYSDLIKLTKRMTEFNQMRDNFNRAREIDEPKLYKFDPEFNKKEELYMNEIRKRRKQQQRSTTPLAVIRNNNVSDRTNTMDGEPSKLNRSHGSPLKKPSYVKSVTCGTNLADMDLMDEQVQPKKGQKYINLLERTKENTDEVDPEEIDGNPATYENDSSVGNRTKGGATFQKVTFFAKKKNNGGKYQAFENSDIRL